MLVNEQNNVNRISICIASKNNILQRLKSLEIFNTKILK